MHANFVGRGVTEEFFVVVGIMDANSLAPTVKYRKLFKVFTSLESRRTHHKWLLKNCCNFVPSSATMHRTKLPHHHWTLVIYTPNCECKMQMKPQIEFECTVAWKCKRFAKLMKYKMENWLTLADVCCCGSENSEVQSFSTHRIRGIRNYNIAAYNKLFAQLVSNWNWKAYTVILAVQK